MKKELLTFRRTSVLLLTTLFPLLLFSQSIQISIDKNRYQIDSAQGMILSLIDIQYLDMDLTGASDVQLSLGELQSTFDTVPSQIRYTQAYPIHIDTNAYTLYFTPLPIISIQAPNGIVDEPKLPGFFTYVDQEQLYTSVIGIELRGGLSQSFPKKTYDLELWEDDIEQDSRDGQFGQLREDDDWILDGIYNEPLRMRAYLSHKLWIEANDLSYKESEPEAKSGADVMYVEVFLDGSYNGLYMLSEQVDRKQLKLKKYNDTIRGELYKGDTWGATTFSELEDFDNTNREWGGYEYKYPDDDETTDWNNVYDFTNFVMNSSDEEFTSGIWDRFQQDNFVNYFIFLNLLRARDNTGKNIYLARYNAETPYFYVPWDLDGTWGNQYDGVRDTVTDDILGNGFHDRVLDLGQSRLDIDFQSAWNDLRANTYATDKLLATFDSTFQFLKSHLIYDREKMVYPNYAFDDLARDYTLEWTAKRLAYLDEYFNEIINSNREFVVNDPNHLVYPNPANHRINLLRKNEDAPLMSNYSLQNIYGQRILEGSIHGNHVEIQISGVEPGLYFLVIDRATTPVTIQ